MSAVPYFAYGSNMLTPRLRARCPTARVYGPASVTGWRLAFSKPSEDGSGKATLARAEDDSARVLGVLYEIDACDMPVLDRVEEKGVGYDRMDDFDVVCVTRGAVVPHTTYLARTPQSGLNPYDWYLALVVAGAREHAFEPDYITELLNVPRAPDPNPDRKSRLAALKALRKAGYDSPAELFGGR